MNIPELLDILFGVSFTIFGWFAREMWNAVKELQADLSHLREEIPKTYVSKDIMKEAFNDIKSMLIRIDTKLDHKVDKS